MTGPRRGETIYSNTPLAQFTRSLPPKDPDAVTLGDLMKDPKAAMLKIGANVGKEATDPKTWVALAASYFGPKMMGAVMPVVGRAAAAAGSADVAGTVKDLATLGIGDSRVSAGLRLATRLGKIMQPNEAPVEPAPLSEQASYERYHRMASNSYDRYMPNVGAEPSQTPFRPQVGPVEPTSPVTAVAGYDRYMPNVSSEPNMTPKAEPSPIQPPQSAAPLKLSGPEVAQGMKWKQQGISDQDIVNRIMQAREFVQKMQLQTPDQVRAAIAAREASGAWK